MAPPFLLISYLTQCREEDLTDLDMAAPIVITSVVNSEIRKKAQQVNIWNFPCLDGTADVPLMSDPPFLPGIGYPQCCAHDMSFILNFQSKQNVRCLTFC
jgi:hypothetical protein